MASDEEQEDLYCICREKYDGQKFMIECDMCKDWFHGSCVGVKENQASDIESYHCPTCQKDHGPLVLKKRRNSQRHDYSEENAAMAKVIQTGSLEFVRELKSRTFPGADEVILHFRNGAKLSMSYFEENGFSVPILVDNKDGLGVKVPPPNFSIHDVENYVGSMREIDVIDVARQEDQRMVMRRWTEYYTSTERNKVLNVISLEFSKTQLAELVEPPQVVREMSWTTNLWPKEEPQSQEGDVHEKPCVQRYCLMGVKDSYTDFHIDFGGTSVWYHVLRGEKVFYLIEPTDVNLQLYETWLGSSNQSSMFFGDQVQQCYKCTVKQGQTLFIPTGWIHSVLTPIDSLVFGGNFLHSFCIDLQIRVYELEKRVKTPDRYMFPNYETLHWYAAKHIYQEIREFIDNEEPPPFYLVNGAKAMIGALKNWTHKRDLNTRSLSSESFLFPASFRKKYIKRDNIPDNIQYGKLLKDLQKQLRQVSKSVQKPTPPPPPTKAKKKRKLKDSEAEVSAAKEVKLEPEDSKVEVKVEERSLKTEEDSDSKEEVESKPEVKDIVSGSPKAVPFFGHRTPPRALSSPTHPQTDITKSPRLLSRRPSSDVQQASQRLTFRLPKAGAYTGAADTSVYDFDEEEDGGGGGSVSASDNRRKSTKSDSTSDIDVVSPSPEKRVIGPGLLAKQRRRRRMTSGGSDTGTDGTDTVFTSSPEKQLKLKIPAGRVISDIHSPGKSEESHPTTTSTTASTSVDTSVDTCSQDMSQDSGEGEEEEEEDSLVVDESPRRKAPRKQPQGTLKLKLSVDKSQVKEPSSFDTSQDSSFSTNNNSTTAGSKSPATSGADYTTTLPLDHDYTSLTGAKYQEPEHSETEDKPELCTVTPKKEKGPIFDASQFRDSIKMEEINKSSPSMRDAIQGMLSMSQLPASTLQTSVGNSPFVLDREKSKATLRLERESKNRKYLFEEGGQYKKGERLPTVFKDDDFVYPTLEGSEHEDDAVFKPRGRQKKDETWNPKAKLNIKPKGERPARPQARKESVGSQLEDAAAKLANRPPPKREYIRKKPKDKPTIKAALGEFESVPVSKEPALSGYEEIPSTSTGGYMGFASTSEVDEIFGGDLLISPSGQPQQSSAGVVKSVASASSFGGKKHKKGMATAKQRLGKILKIHKML